MSSQGKGKKGGHAPSGKQGGKKHSGKSKGDEDDDELFLALEQQRSAVPPAKGKSSDVAATAVTLSALTLDQLPSAVERNDLKTWFRVGISLPSPDQTATINNKKYSAEDCFKYVLARDPNHGGCWVALARRAIENHRWKEPIVLSNGNHVSVKDCLLRGAEGTPEGDQFYWFGLGFLLARGESVKIQGNTYSKQECLRRAILVDRNNAHAWAMIGHVMDQDDEEFGLKPRPSVTIDNMPYDSRACFQKAFRLDEKCPAAWQGLGFTLMPNEVYTVKLGPTGQRQEKVSRRECALKALSQCLEFSPQYELGHRPRAGVSPFDFPSKTAKAAGQLADCMGLVTTERFGVVDVDKIQMYQLALKYDETDAYAWRRLGDTLAEIAKDVCPKPVKSDKPIPNPTALVRGVLYDRRQCYIISLNLNPKDGGAFTNLGTTMMRDDPPTTVKIGGVNYTMYQCLSRAVQLFQNEPIFWSNMASGMDKDSTVEVKGKTYGKRDCLIEAVQLAERRALYWHYLGNSFLPDDFGGACVVSGTTYGMLDCWAKAVELDKKHPEAWQNLATTLGLEEKKNIPGIGVVNKIRCYEETLSLQPYNAAVWCSLAETFPDDETAIDFADIKGLNKKKCYEAALNADPKHPVARAAYYHYVKDLIPDLPLPNEPPAAEAAAELPLD